MYGVPPHLNFGVSFRMFFRRYLLTLDDLSPTYKDIGFFHPLRWIFITISSWISNKLSFLMYCLHAFQTMTSVDPITSITLIDFLFHNIKHDTFFKSYPAFHFCWPQNNLFPQSVSTGIVYTLIYILHQGSSTQLLSCLLGL